jgi:hypothetical protein
MRPPGARKIHVRYSQSLSGLGALRDHLRHRNHVSGGFQEGLEPLRRKRWNG